MIAYLTLFFRLIVRPLTRDRLRTLLTVLAVALGVAVVIAIELAGVAAAGSFRSSVESLTGEADLEISQIGGLDETLLAKLVALPHPLRFKPRIDAHATVESTGETVPVVGLDLIADAALEQVATSASSIRFDRSLETGVWLGPRFNLSPGDNVRLILNDRAQQFEVLGVLQTSSITEGNLVVMDLSAAQGALDRYGKLDRIDVEVPKGSDIAPWEQVLRQTLPSAAELERQGARTEENRKMLAAFRWNLRVLSYIAVIVGAFLIYNTISVSVVRRRAEIGILRALGATRGAVIAAFLAEGAFFGMLGAAGGLLLGRLLAEGAVTLLASTVESLYVSSTPAPIVITGVSVITALAMGVGVALAAALAPAREAGRVSPVEAMARGQREYTARLHARRDLVAGVAVAAAGAFAATLPPVQGKPLFGYLSALLLIAASALALPAVIQLLAGAYRMFLERWAGVEPMLASRSLVASLWRTSVLVGALSTAVAMMVSVGVMVGSFRQTVLLWMDNQLKADLYLRPAGMGRADRFPTMASEIADAIEKLPGVAAVDRFRAYTISYNGMPATLGAGDTRVNARFGRTAFLWGQDRDEIFRRLPTGDYAIISEPFANKHNLRAGDDIRLPIGDAERRFRILGVYYDYASERGYVILDRNVLLRYLPDPAPSNLAVFAAPGRDLAELRGQVERVTAGREVMIFTNRTLRTEAIRIFDRTFAITYALEAVAIVVAVIGIAGALLALVIDRRREFGLLRFLGASAGQIRRLILFEAGFIGLLSNLVGLGLGFVLSLLLIYVINRQSFGWTIQFHTPVWLLVSGLMVVYLATILAGLYPSRTAVRLNPVEVIHEE